AWLCVGHGDRCVCHTGYRVPAPRFDSGRRLRPDSGRPAREHESLGHLHFWDDRFFGLPGRRRHEPIPPTDKRPDTWNPIPAFPRSILHQSTIAVFSSLLLNVSTRVAIVIQRCKSGSEALCESEGKAIAMTVDLHDEIGL